MTQILVIIFIEKGHTGSIFKCKMITHMNYTRLSFNHLLGLLIITTVILKKGPAITKVPHTAWAHTLSL